MAKKPDAWMPLYVGDYLADTGHLSAAEHGAYLCLIMHYWRAGGPITADDNQLRRIARMTTEEWAGSKGTLAAFFEVGSATWRHLRIEEELAAAKERSETARARAGARWGEAQTPADGDAKRARSKRLAAARQIGTHTHEEWIALLAVCGTKCLSCGAEGVVRDHIKPIYQGGSDGIDNIQPLCRECNASKGPEAKDYRSADWRERLQERLHNASPSPSPSPSPSESPLKETPNGVSPASRSRAAAEQLSPVWKPSDDERDLATALGLSPADLERESRKFVFYYTAGKGSGRRSTPRGWRQTWANWISKAVERLPDFAESQPATVKREWRWRWAPSMGDANREQISARLAGWKFSTAKTLAGQCEIDIDGDRLLLRAPNRMVSDMLSQQHDDEIRRAWNGPIAVSLHTDKRAA